MKRRHFIIGGAAALAATDAGIKAALAARPSGIKFGACDWTLKLTADPASLDLAKRIGLDGVQVDYGGEPGKGWLAAAFQREAAGSIPGPIRRDGSRHSFAGDGRAEQGPVEE